MGVFAGVRIHGQHDMAVCRHRARQTCRSVPWTGCSSNNAPPSRKIGGGAENVTVCPPLGGAVGQMRRSAAGQRGCLGNLLTARWRPWPAAMIFDAVIGFAARPVALGLSWGVRPGHCCRWGLAEERTAWPKVGVPVPRQNSLVPLDLRVRVGVAVRHDRRPCLRLLYLIIVGLFGWLAALSNRQKRAQQLGTRAAARARR